ncbi:thioesterase family protein [Veillonella magna]|jgi:acyl-CoA thioester hydrolase|uniref:acyl-CoA thioesterase n=1 Tax=Veillonella magna TaxID=464322 RepID=UPI000483798C|nr:thioesterase family protein [Veillonella magna]MBD8976755.1 acyl-CoA thioesterase [Veillonella magna]
MFTTSLQVRFYETDMMEVAHHTNHLRWFEMGRVEFFRSCGISLWDMMNEGIVFPITKVSCEYKEPARFDDIITVEVTVAKLTRAQCVFTYRLVREADGALIATGETQNVFTDKETGKIIRLPDVFYKAMVAKAAKKEEAHEQGETD